MFAFANGALRMTSMWNPGSAELLVVFRGFPVSHSSYSSFGNLSQCSLASDSVSPMASPSHEPRTSEVSGISAVRDTQTGHWPPFATWSRWSFLQLGQTSPVHFKLRSLQFLTPDGCEEAGHRPT